MKHLCVRHELALLHRCFLLPPALAGSSFLSKKRKSADTRKRIRKDGLAMKKYFILLAVLVICVGAVWYFSNEPAKPQDAVLAYGGCMTL